MASGDAQRVWFPEMIEELTDHWSSSMTWAELSDFCRSMTDKRKQIRDIRGIKPPRCRCKRCGTVSQQGIHPISIRSALFTLKNNGTVSEEEFKKLDKKWKKFKKENNLDAFGNMTGSWLKETWPLLQETTLSNNKNQKWIEAKRKFHLSDLHIQMARELGLNPKKFGSLANHKQEKWKAPLPEFIEEIYFKRFKKEKPDEFKKLK